MNFTDQLANKNERENACISAHEIEVRERIEKLMTETIRTVPISALSLPCTEGSLGKLGDYPVASVITDYSCNKGPERALFEMLAKSDCPLVAAYRKALSDEYADYWATEVARSECAE
jgi:hypothetical protein